MFPWFALLSAGHATLGFPGCNIVVTSSPWVVRYTGSSRKASHLLLKTVR